MANDAVGGPRDALATLLAECTGARRAKQPEFVLPNLATLVDQPPSSSGWVHEIKFDGYRVQAWIKSGEVRLLTRSGKDWSARFSAIGQALRRLHVQSAILDGEVVVEKATGVTSFADLVADLQSGRTDRMIYYVFDLLYCNGLDLTGVPLKSRKKVLKKCLPGRNSLDVRYSEHLDADGKPLLRQACDAGLEGIISKRADSVYRSGRNRTWLKSKCIENDEFVIAGYVPSSAHSESVGALLAAYFDKKALHYAGRIGTGFSRRAAHELWQKLQPLRRQGPVLSVPLTTLQRRGVIFTDPKIVAQVEYRGWTTDGLIRHGVFKALREDKSPRSVRRPSAN